MQLADHHALGAVHDERALGGHVGDLAQVHVLHDGLEVLVLGIGAVQLQLGLQRHAVGEAALDALIDAVAGRIDEVVQELQHELVARVRDGEVLAEYLEEAFLLAVLGERVDLEELLEALELDVEEIGIIDTDLAGAEIDALAFLDGLRLGHGWGSGMEDGRFT